MCEYLEDAPIESFFINRNIVKNISGIVPQTTEMSRHAASRTPRSLSIFCLFFPLHLGFLYILTWSGVPPDMSDDQTPPVCGWFIFNEKTLWSGLRAASNAHHLQITMIKHSNGTDSYPKSSHTFRLHASNSWMDLESEIISHFWNTFIFVFNVRTRFRCRFWIWTRPIGTYWNQANRPGLLLFIVLVHLDIII